MQIDTTIVYRQLEQCKKRIIAHQGGTRSSKTYNIVLWIIFSYCSRNKGKLITLCRKTFPALRGSVMRDFFNILDHAGKYDEKLHDKTHHEYKLNGNLVEFLAIDSPEKAKSRKRHLLFICEANELNYDDFFQLNIRTTEKVIVDFNPSFEYHWLYDEVINREECELFITTYKDNPFLETDEINEITRMEKISPWHWTVYGLGQRGKYPNIVFRYILSNIIPESAKLLGTGLDWGFVNDPSTIIDVYRDGDNLYLKERCYQTGMTNSDINRKLIEIDHKKPDAIYYDNSRPDSGEELRRMGWRMLPAKSRTTHNNYGIDLAQRFTINLIKEDLNLIKEFNNYIYKTDSANKVTNVPVDLFNHGIDAFIYVLIMTLGKGTGKYAIN